MPVTGLVEAYDSRQAGARTLSVTGYLVNDGNGGADYVVHLHTASGSITARDLDINAVTGTGTCDSARKTTKSPSTTRARLRKSRER